MKKKSIKNLSLNKKSISKLHTSNEVVGGTLNSIKYCIRTFIDVYGNNVCIRTVLNCDRTKKPGCVFTNEVDSNTLPIC